MTKQQLESLPKMEVALLDLVILGDEGKHRNQNVHVIYS